MQKLLKLFGVIVLFLMVTLLSGCIKLSLFSKERNYFVGSTEILERIEDLEERLDACDDCRERCSRSCAYQCEEDDDDDDD